MNARPNSTPAKRRLFRRPASAHSGQSIASEATLTPAHIAVYGPSVEGRERQFFCNAGKSADLGEQTVAALQSDASGLGAGAGSLNASSIAATLAIAQLDAQRPVKALLSTKATERKQLHDGSAFSKVHTAFGVGRRDAWVRRDAVTGYLWREVRDPQVMEREAVMYRHLSDRGVPSPGIVKVLGNDRRHIAIGTAAPTSFRSIQFVIAEPYRCTLTQGLAESEAASRRTGENPPLPAPAVARFLRDVLQQLAHLHESGMTHNMVHASLMCIAPQPTDDFDRSTRFARKASQLAASRRSRTGTSCAGSDVGSCYSYGGPQSSRPSSAVASSAGGDSDPHAQEVVAPPTFKSPVATDKVEAAPMFGDLALCVGKLMDLSAATIFNVEALKALEPYTLSAQRQDPDASSLRQLPELPDDVTRFASPPEWFVTLKVPRNTRWSGGPARVLRSAAAECPPSRRPDHFEGLATRRERSHELTGDFDDDESELVTQRLDTILPLPPSDVYLFGRSVREVFRPLLDAAELDARTEVAEAAKAREMSAGANVSLSADPAKLRREAEVQRQLGCAAMSHTEHIGIAECVHFVEQATLDLPQRRLTVKQSLAHPFFWTPSMAATFVSLLADFLSAPRAESAADTLALASAARGAKSSAAAAKARQVAAQSLSKSPAEASGCSRDLLRWASVLNTFSAPRSSRGAPPSPGGSVTTGETMGILSSNDPSVSWLPHVRDWYEALCHDNVAGVRYDYENTIRDQLTFFANVHAHLRNHGTATICDGDEGQFTTTFLHDRFPGSLLLWLRRLAHVPGDGEKFLSWVQRRGRVDVPHSDEVVACVQRFVAEQRSAIAEKSRVVEQARLRAAVAGRRMGRR